MGTHAQFLQGMPALSCFWCRHKTVVCAVLCCAVAVFFGPQVPPNVQEAQQWIANWRAKQGGTQPPSSSSKPAAAAAVPKASTSSSSGSNGAPVPPNVQEAREWIANWRAKQGGGSGSSSGGGAQPEQEQQQQQGDGEVTVVGGEDIMASVTNFFKGFGGQK